MTITWNDLTERGESARCRSCQAPIYWVLTEKGKRAPYNADAGPNGEPVSHFATCPESQAWRRSKARA